MKADFKPGLGNAGQQAETKKTRHTVGVPGRGVIRGQWQEVIEPKSGPITVRTAKSGGDEGQVVEVIDAICRHRGIAAIAQTEVKEDRYLVVDLGQIKCGSPFRRVIRW